LRSANSQVIITDETRQNQQGKEEIIPFIGVWSLLDLLAHLAGWDVANLLAAQEVPEGKIPSFYAHYSKDWAEYNALLVSRYSKETLAEMLATVEDTHRQLLDHLERASAKTLFADHGVRVGSYRVIISRLLEAERKDEIRHLRQVVEFLDERRAQPNRVNRHDAS
jgi:cytochrome P450